MLMPALVIRPSFFGRCVGVCVHSSFGARLSVCQVCVNRDERCGVRTWPCIIHEADLAEESQGSPVLL